jgi:hypothetical protein
MCPATLSSEQKIWNMTILLLLKTKKDLKRKFYSASIDFDMPDAETFMEEVDSSQPMNMQEEDTINDTCLVPLRTLMNINICRYAIYITNGRCFTNSNRRVLHRNGRIRKPEGHTDDAHRIKLSNCLTM